VHDRQSPAYTVNLIPLTRHSPSACSR